MSIRPKYYQGKDGKDLFSRFEDGLLSPDGVRGMYVGTAMKYLTRYRQKNGLEDLDKAMTYIEELKQFEIKQAHKTTGRSDDR